MKILIYVDDNKIGTEGCVKIIQSLREHKMLKVLDLGKYICLLGKLYICSNIITIYSNILPRNILYCSI